MRRYLRTPEHYEGPDSFWGPIRYLTGEPEVGLVVLHHLLNTDEIEQVQTAARQDVAEQAFIDKMPNERAARRILKAILEAKGIAIEALHEVNGEYAGEKPVNKKSFVFTGFGKEESGAHTDAIKTNIVRPVGTSLSLTIGECAFAAALPPVDVRKPQGPSDSYDRWMLGEAATRTETMHYAVLDPGDAAFWLQPGFHETAIDDPSRFGCLQITIVPLQPV